MGPKHPKTTVTNTAVFLRFKRPVQYFGDRGDREGLPKLRAFSGPVYNTSFFPSELLCAIFGSLRDLSFLGTIAQVCRYWCVLVYNTEFLWASLLLDLRRTGETISSREEVYRRSLVWLPNLYMELVERGYCIENGLEFQTFVQGDRGVGKSALTIQLSQNVFIGMMVACLICSAISLDLIFSEARSYHRRDLPRDATISRQAIEIQSPGHLQCPALHCHA